MRRLASFIFCAFACSISVASDSKEPSPWALQWSGTAQHFNESQHKRHTWNQENWGIGLQYDRRQADSHWSQTYSLGALKDSYGVMGAYLSAAQMREIAQLGSMETQAGVGLFALWRAMSWSGKRQFIAAPLPVMHVEEKTSGVGLNVVVSPSVNVGKHRLPGFAFFQITSRF